MTARDESPNPTTLTAVLWDLDGTLIDSGRDISAAFLKALAHVSHTPLPEVSAVIRHIGKSHPEMLSLLGFEVTGDRFEAFRTVYRSHFAEYGIQYTQPFPGVRDSLSRFADVAMGVVTTKAQDQAEMVLQKLELAHHFRHVQGARPGIPLKPAPDSIIAALAALACPPEQALMVGDTTADILAGKAAGVRTCAVTYGFGDPHELQSCEPTYLVTSFDELVAIIEMLMLQNSV
jgi:HAD superfamily hydrolase (TIGR01509 family)